MLPKAKIAYFIVGLIIFALIAIQNRPSNLAPYMEAKKMETSALSENQYEEPNPKRPPNVLEFLSSGWGGDGSAYDKIYWDSTFRGDSSKWSEARNFNSAVEADGKIPYFSLVSWGGETCNNEVPTGQIHGKWLAKRKNLLAVDAAGNPFDAQNNGCVETVVPSMPLDPKDWPSDTKNAHFGDYIANRLKGFIEATHIRGLSAADYWDNLPHTSTTNIDFNQRSIDDFKQWANVSIAGSTIAEQSSYILNNYAAEWADYISDGYARMYGAIAKAIKDATGKYGIIALQGTNTIAEGSFQGQDLRKLSQRINVENGGHFLKTVELQPDPGRALTPVTFGIAWLGVFAATAPDTWIGTQLPAPAQWPPHVNSNDDLEYVVRKSFENRPLSEKETISFIDNYLKSMWLGVGWTHIANQDGTVRRAMQYYLPQYNGNYLVPGHIKEMLLDRYPVRPFGAALYYSKNVEQAFKERGQAYPFERNTIRMLNERNLPIGYVLSDLAIDGLEAHPENKPTAIYVPNGAEYLSEDELAKLRRIAPVFDGFSINMDKVIHPIKFSSEMTGYAFVDQHGETIVLAWHQQMNPWNWDWTSLNQTPLTATISFEGVENGKYSVVNLFDKKDTYSLSVQGGKGSFSFDVEGFGFRAFKTNIPSPNGNWNIPVTYNLAQNKPAYMSSWLWDSPNTVADNAVDGNTNGEYWESFSIAATNDAPPDDEPWWEVDLLGEYSLNKINVWSRTDCCSLSDYWVYVYDNNRNLTWSSFVTDINNPKQLSVADVKGRYVRIVKPGKSQTINLAEVEVFGHLISGGKSSSGASAEPEIAD